MGEAIWLAGLIAHEALLFAAVGFLIGGFDDLAIDLIWLIRRVVRKVTVYRRYPRATLADFAPPRCAYAMFVPAWDEGAVLGSMLRTTLARLPHPGLTVFVACYANDIVSVAAASAVAADDRRVVVAINPRLGPTTKADNLNTLWRALEQHEAKHVTRFHAVVIHDAEDVVASGELRVFEHLLKRAGVVQLPVMPLVDHGSRWVSGHYMDEFAESHVKQMVVREALGAALPLAGTGFAIERALLGRLARDRGGMPFDADSLTEDYELGLALAAHGARAMLARVASVSGGQPVAVRAHFPDTIDTAVRQKARWMTGIALAGWDRVGWSGWRDRPLRENWMRMRDRRALVAVPVTALAYLGLAAWVIGVLLAWWSGRAAIALDIAAWLLWTNAALMAWRLAMRAAIVTRVYGWREGVRSAPRALVANIVALLAARRALPRYIAMLRGGATSWDKTRHVYPETLPAE